MVVKLLAAFLILGIMLGINKVNAKRNQNKKDTLIVFGVTWALILIGLFAF